MWIVIVLCATHYIHVVQEREWYSRQILVFKKLHLGIKRT